MIRLASAFIFACVCAPLVSANAPPLTTAVFVTTDVRTPGVPTSEEAERLALVSSIMDGIPSNKRISSQVTFAPDRESANIVLQVTDAKVYESTSFLPHDLASVALRYWSVVRLIFGRYSTDFSAGASSGRYRRSVYDVTEWDPLAVPRITEMRLKAAITLTSRIHDWITTNNAELRRGTPY